MYMTGVKSLPLHVIKYMSAKGCGVTFGLGKILYCAFTICSDSLYKIKFAIKLAIKHGEPV